jgi:hypothetical protein
MNVEIKAEATLFPEKEYIKGIYVAVHTANEGSERFQYKGLVLVYVFQEIKKCAASLLPKQDYYVVSPNFHTHVPVSDLYFPTIGLPI